MNTKRNPGRRAVLSGLLCTLALTQRMWRNQLTWRITFACVIGVLVANRPAYATDGTILISQAKAMAGNVTPGDAPGFPVTISRPGSYRLSSNLTVPNADTHGIEVTVATFSDGANVTLDLNGFAILGPNRCQLTVGVPRTLSCTFVGSGNGIQALGAFNVIVMNGTIRGMGNGAIFIQNSLDIATRIERMTISHNSFGIYVDRGLVINNSVGTNRFNGIELPEGLAQGNVILGNGGIALALGSEAGYTNNVISTGSIQQGASTVDGGTSLGQNLCGGLAC